jgi:hypothetical protein
MVVCFAPAPIGGQAFLEVRVRFLDGVMDRQRAWPGRGKGGLYPGGANRWSILGRSVLRFATAIATTQGIQSRLRFRKKRNKLD